MHVHKRLTLSVLIGAFIVAPLLALAQQGVDSTFNPNLIIPDEAFNDTRTFGGAEGVQQFLNSKNSILANTSPDFIAKLNEPNSPSLKTTLEDPQPNLDHSRSAAELIWDAAQSSGMNPQVILVTLNKEQGLITGSAPKNLQKVLDRAMGFACPDTTGCGDLFPGFYYQLFGNVDTAGNRYLGATKSLMKSFYAQNGRGPAINGRPAQVGETIVLQNTIGGYSGILPLQLVTLSNRATAALYRYTPHVFNGNYNFWKFFVAWFKYPNGTLLKASDSGIVYIIQNGARQQIPDFVFRARTLNPANIITASALELQSYPLGEFYGPSDNTIVDFNGVLSVFINNERHPASSFVLSQRKLNPASALEITNEESSLFASSTQLVPSEGTVIREKNNGDIYIVKNGILQLFSPFTYRQYNVAKQVQIIPDGEIASYPKGTFIPPHDGTLIKGTITPAIYIVNQGKRHPLTDELFKNLGYNKKDIVLLTNPAELAAMEIGAAPTPKENTYFTTHGTGEIFLYKNGAKHLLSSFVAKQRNVRPTISFEVAIANAWPYGIVVPPLDGTLVRGVNAPTVYLLKNGQLRPLTTALFKNLGYLAKQIVTLSNMDIMALPTADFVTPKEKTFFSVTPGKQLHLFKDGAMHSISLFVAKQRSITPDFTFESTVTTNWPVGAPVFPLENTIVRGASSPTIYTVTKNTLVPVPAKTRNSKNFKKQTVHTLPQAEIENYLKKNTNSK
ncbi:MAG: hypothetical protein Q7S47_00510 [bacterium]|nr:hypothetical protein [bacterium]